MKKLLLSFIVLSMMFCVMATLGACKSEAETKMEKNLQDARDASQRLKEIEKEAKDIMNKP